MPERISPKVLVADDEHMIADTITMILNQTGFEAQAVYSGEDAIDMAEKFRPNMLICDVAMTGINGIEAAIRILAKLPACRILLFSGQAVSADLLQKARVRGYEFELLLKPLHPADLIARLRSLDVQQAA